MLRAMRAPGSERLTKFTGHGLRRTELRPHRVVGNHGKRVLSVIKRDVLLKSIPVIVMTTSEADTDFVDLYNLQANTCVTKPIEFEKFIQAVLRLDEFSVSNERMNDRILPQNALAAHGVGARTGARPKAPTRFG